MGSLRFGTFSALAIACALAFTTAVPAPASADDGTIVFGAALAATGSTAREGELTKEGYEFWTDYVNAHGGINVGGKTYKVDINYADDESNPQTAARLVEKFVSQDKVNFILGPYGSANSATAAAVVERLNVPMVEGNGAAEQIFNQGFKYTFGMLAPGRKYLAGIIEMALSAEAEAEDRRDRAATTRSRSRSAARRGGLGEATTASTSSTTTSIRPTRPTCRRSSARSKRRTPTSCSTAAISTTRCCCNARSKSSTSTPRSSAIRSARTPRTSARRSARTRTGSSAARSGRRPRSTAARPVHRRSKVYAAEFAKKYGHAPDYHDAESTAACLAFQYAMQSAGSIDPRRCATRSPTLDVVTFYGILKFDSRGINVFKPMAVNQIQKVSLMTVWPMGVQNAKPMYPTPRLEQALSGGWIVLARSRQRASSRAGSSPSSRSASASCGA